MTLLRTVCMASWTYKEVALVRSDIAEFGVGISRYSDRLQAGRPGFDSLERQGSFFSFP
jgi:hypothetical protein